MPDYADWTNRQTAGWHDCLGRSRGRERGERGTEEGRGGTE